MTQTHAGWFVLIAAVGTLLGLLGAEIGSMASWAAATSPAFVGKALIHIGAVAGAFVGGKLLPQVGGQ